MLNLTPLQEMSSNRPTHKHTDTHNCHLAPIRRQFRTDLNQHLPRLCRQAINASQSITISFASHIFAPFRRFFDPSQRHSIAMDDLLDLSWDAAKQSNKTNAQSMPPPMSTSSFSPRHHPRHSPTTLLLSHLAQQSQYYGSSPLLLPLSPSHHHLLLRTTWISS